MMFSLYAGGLWFTGFFITLVIKDMTLAIKNMTLVISVT